MNISKKDCFFFKVFDICLSLWTLICQYSLPILNFHATKELKSYLIHTINMNTKCCCQFGLQLINNTVVAPEHLSTRTKHHAFLRHEKKNHDKMFLDSLCIHRRNLKTVSRFFRNNLYMIEVIFNAPIECGNILVLYKYTGHNLP